MNAKTVLDSLTDKSFLLKALQTTPEDAFIYGVVQLGEVLDPFVGNWTQNVGKLIPASLLALKSPHHTDELPFMNPVHVIMVAVLYLVVIFLGVNVMKHFQRFDVKQFALGHNIFLTALSAYMASGLAYEAYRSNYGVLGNPVIAGDGGIRMAKLCWLFFISKIPEFADTLIMVLKKNNRQISFLHLYHHSSVLLVTWFCVFVAPGGEMWYSAAVNSFVHVIMYGYYFLSSLGVKQVAFVKKYITQMQMTQFVLNMVQAAGVGYLYPAYARLFGLDPTFVYPPIIGQIQIFYMVSMLVLFANFYIQDRKREKLSRSQGGSVDEKKKKL
ncbi:hypothetical protein BCR33DRAFT_719540 [Rhizoclosmatium globosum]|uniref:Elongation of fatty acids protein n=1 Tax=Rhizoclosmatium globosum TaxID=329046 RepID=A0A1Y2C1F4_9FUNG|nr:hypothetical protein HDU99_008957 [Rhizoclosmatium hyalinum]KAJ3290295.1 hypothetical protein HDU79_003397 [Rhizoclosmatium sp. JEL0117]ORY40135.1 hypothetical protein BCR33DRAFT_719540 [Rhizoclosmatium globosum]|eukprot:ORY40135.1 hypothetical protein BCR33DRAFT_719540 [Rhizoclosmatium globosum]